MCLVCGESLLGDDDNSSEPEKETIKWYYYDGGSATLTTIVNDVNSFRLTLGKRA